MMKLDKITHTLAGAAIAAALLPFGLIPALLIGNAGDICWDSDYIYVCVATNTWKRSAISTW